MMLNIVQALTGGHKVHFPGGLKVVTAIASSGDGGFGAGTQTGALVFLLRSGDRDSRQVAKRRLSAYFHYQLYRRGWSGQPIIILKVLFYLYRYSWRATVNTECHASI